jgi:hypothetical protein
VSYVVILLSTLLGLLRARPARPDRRVDRRYEAYHSVTIRVGRYSGVGGKVIDLSMGGAAVLIPGWRARAPAGWLTHLNRGDKLRLVGLLDAQVPCTIVTVEAGVLRVMFDPDDTARGQLRELIASLASP